MALRLQDGEAALMPSMTTVLPPKHITNTPRAGESDEQAAARSNRRGDNQLEVSRMNEMPRHIDEHMSREIADEMARLNRTSGNPNVDRPSHYVASNGLEALDFIEAFSMGFHEGTITQYLIRWRKKNGLEDLHKARVYLDRLILIAEGGR